MQLIFKDEEKDPITTNVPIPTSEPLKEKVKWLKAKDGGNVDVNKQVRGLLEALYDMRVTQTDRPWVTPPPSK